MFLKSVCASNIASRRNGMQLRNIIANNSPNVISFLNLTRDLKKTHMKKGAAPNI
jgi:hypothetical protein